MEIAQIFGPSGFSLLSGPWYTANSEPSARFELEHVAPWDRSSDDGQLTGGPASPDELYDVLTEMTVAIGSAPMVTAALAGVQESPLLFGRCAVALIILR